MSPKIPPSPKPFVKETLPDDADKTIESLTANIVLEAREALRPLPPPQILSRGQLEALRIHKTEAEFRGASRAQYARGLVDGFRLADVIDDDHHARLHQKIIAALQGDPDGTAKTANSDPGSVSSRGGDVPRGPAPAKAKPANAKARGRGARGGNRGSAK